MRPVWHGGRIPGWGRSSEEIGSTAGWLWPFHSWTRGRVQYHLGVSTDSDPLIDVLPVTPHSIDKENYGLPSATQNCEEAPPIRANCNFHHALFNDATRSARLTPWDTPTGQLQEFPVAPWSNTAAFKKIPNFWTFEHAWSHSYSWLFIIMMVEKPK